MKISELWARQKEQTEKVSTVCRQLAFGGAAICWFFKSADVRFPLPIVFSLLMFTGFFLSDTSQYYFTANKYSHWIRSREDDLTRAGKSIEVEEISPPPYPINRNSYRLYTCKVLFLLSGYFCIALELVMRTFIAG
jgi:hypothetical protein